MPLLAATAGNVPHTTVFTFEQLKQSLYLVSLPRSYKGRRHDDGSDNDDGVAEATTTTQDKIKKNRFTE